MTKLIYTIPADQVSPDDQWVAPALAASTIPSVIGTLTQDDVLTTDTVCPVYFAIDTSGSLSGQEMAVITGIEGVVGPTGVTQPGLYHELQRISRGERAKFRIQIQLFNTTVREHIPLTRLFIPDPANPSRDIRNPKVTPLTTQNYRPSGLTNTILAVKRLLADALAHTAVMALPDFEVATRNVVVIVTDGFCNQGTVGELEEIRRTIKRLRAQESWTFLKFCVAEIGIVRDFRKAASKISDAQWYVERLIQERGFTDDTVANPSTGHRYTALEKAWAQLMFETMATGWGSYADTQQEVVSIAGDEGRIAQLYLACERIISKTILGGEYTGIGGFAIPAANVSTIFFESNQIAQMLGMKVSSSIIKSVSVGAAPAAAPSVSTPSQPSASSAW